MGDYFRVNVLGTEHLLAAAAARARAGGVRLLSAEVYGVVPEDEQPIAEDAGRRRRSPYALTKAAAERMALAPARWWRARSTWSGRGRRRSSRCRPSPASSPPSRAATPSRCSQVGNLSARRDFVHVADGARASLPLASAASRARSTTWPAARRFDPPRRSIA